MRRVRLLLSSASAMAILAGIFAGCSEDSPPAASHEQTYRGVLVGGSEVAALSLTLTSTHGNHLLAPVAQRGTISGALSIEGVASYPVSGTYDASTDSINF